MRVSNAASGPLRAEVGLPANVYPPEAFDEQALRGRVLGGQMTRFAVNRLRERGVAQMWLSVGDPNLRAMLRFVLWSWPGM